MEIQQLLDLTCHQILRLLEDKSANEMRTILDTLSISQTDALITAFEWLTNFEVIRSHEEMEPDEQPDVLYALQLLLRLEKPDLILFYDGTLGDWSSLYDWLMQACNPASKAALLIAKYITGRLSSGLHGEETQRILCQDARFKNYFDELEYFLVLTTTWVAAYTPTVRGPPKSSGGDFKWHCVVMGTTGEVTGSLLLWAVRINPCGFEEREAPQSSASGSNTVQQWSSRG